ncbi:MAG TPA: hypothetical protein VD837_02400 [Terriglobales bacterium]|nr:hypothetical protein [Terriglobales bacterium]
MGPTQTVSHRSEVSRDGVLRRYINLKLAALGQPTSASTADPEFIELARPLLRTFHEKDRMVGERQCPADRRVQDFLNEYLNDVCPGGAPLLPGHTFVLDQAGLARVLSLPPTRDEFTSPLLYSYRLRQGVLHNPKSDRRTTQGIFHIVEGGLGIPADKIGVPKRTFARMLDLASRPPDALMELPFTADQADRVKLWVSLLLRPTVCPSIGNEPSRTMETRFFVPGSLVSNLDFVEAIFGNAGDPYLPENDAALDVERWTGHTGCVILAPHLVGTKKKDVGLPRWEDANERQRRDGMCWKDESELYNDGRAFKLTCRDERGVIVTIIADNYFGYCKKEVKTQISYAANLYGVAEEEHAGGAIAFPSYVLGQEYREEPTATFEAALALLGDSVQLMPEGYAVDREYSSIVYVPEHTKFDVRHGSVSWKQGDQERTLPLVPGRTYILPSGYKVRLEKQAGGGGWHLIGTRADGTLCHKPSTVSGGGKSEISKSIAGSVLQGPVFVKDFKRDLDRVDEILQTDFSNIFRRDSGSARAVRPILSPGRSLGSVIKLLTPSPEYTDEYNQWLRDLPQTIRQLVFTVKRYYRPEWGANWREHFTVDSINGFPGHELKFNNQKLVGEYLRVGFAPDGSWRIFKLRPDFHPADKVQVEDDITASAVLPASKVPDLRDDSSRSVKLVENCEAMLFQRPDDAIHRGADKQAETDIASEGVFLSNFEPLTKAQARAIVDRVVEFDQYTEPMQNILRGCLEDGGPDFVASSAHPRIVDGKPSKNPRYLQKRPDLVHPEQLRLAEVGTRLLRRVPAGQRVHFPVDAVLAGRRNNPPDPKIGLPALAVYSPIHYQELPELFMDFACSLTGKSPSTTGFGSEGALTKAPFNALWPVVDLNNALVGMILTGYAGFSTAAGHVGPQFRVDHDVSMLVPEVWCRMTPHERDARFLIENGYLEKVQDFNYEGRRVLASRLGYRITMLFADRFLGRVFERPDAVFTEAMLCPEKQGLEVFVEGVDSILDAQKRVALNYFADGSIEAACPPLSALLHIMAYGQWNGYTVDSPEVRQLFTRESLLASDWYQQRLAAKHRSDIELWERKVRALEHAQVEGVSCIVNERLQTARKRLAHVRSENYRSELVGTIGADPFVKEPSA